ncbi:MAG: 1-acyl-sn-glycerol-3-phosphate acyltransferase [Tannerellaceae bacterium]|jgi:putative hemolysin|nr:1-acyl-sn-glycerol-3-phosphate acyltransferase [Tannerellaceae bacterium]
MKETVIDINDLQDMIPALRTPLGRIMGQRFLRSIGMEKVNKVHGQHCHLRGAAFTEALLADPLIDIHYRLHCEDRLDTLPEGAFITVSNHPTGSIEGIMLIDIFARRRTDFKVMANGFLTRIGAMEANFIPVVPPAGKQEDKGRANVGAIRHCLEHLSLGGPLGFFPAGSVSFLRWGKIRDLSWSEGVMRIIRKAAVPVYPICFDVRNTSFFYMLGQLDWRIRVLRMPAETFNKRGKTVDVFVGKPVSADDIRRTPDDAALAALLYRRTYEREAQ